MKSDPDLKLFGVEKNPPPEFEEEEDLDDFPASVKSTLPVSSSSSSSKLR